MKGRPVELLEAASCSSGDEREREEERGGSGAEKLARSGAKAAAAPTGKARGRSLGRQARTCGPRWSRSTRGRSAAHRSRRWRGRDELRRDARGRVVSGWLGGLGVCKGGDAETTDCATGEGSGCTCSTLTPPPESVRADETSSTQGFAQCLLAEFTRQVKLVTRLRGREQAQAESSRQEAARLATRVDAAESPCRELRCVLQRLRPVAPAETAGAATSPLHPSALPPSSPLPDTSGEPHSPSHGATAEQQQQRPSRVVPAPSIAAPQQPSPAALAAAPSAVTAPPATGAVPPAPVAMPTPPADSRGALLSAVHPQVLDSLANLLAGRPIIIEDRSTPLLASSQSPVPSATAIWR
ncbi:hypothetical protein Efla_006981 [Eimeria flavescens]